MMFSTDVAPFHSVVQRSGWSSLTLSQRFLLLSGLLIVVSLAILGAWTTNKIESAITFDVGFRAAGVLESALAPFSEELASGALTDTSRDAIDRDLASVTRRLRVIEVKIWSLDGRILYDSDRAEVGLSFPIDGLLRSAISGRVSVATDTMIDAAEGASTLSPEVDVFEIYVPIRARSGSQVIAVGEFYQDSGVLGEALTKARRETWAVVGLVSLALVAGLYLVVAQGNELIEQQRSALRDKVTELTDLLSANERLRSHIQAASSRTNEDVEVHLRRIGSDIHDGIGQLLTIALLRLDQALPDAAVQNESFQAVRSTLEDAMAEVREMTAGLSLPQMQQLPLAEAIKTVVLRHRRRTSTEAKVTIAPNIAEPSHPVKLAICRFVQEGLSNAFKHAGGRGQSIDIGWDRSMITVTVSDSGPGLTPSPVVAERMTLGLAGLRNRVESLGGVFEIEGTSGRGTVVSARFPVAV